MHGSASLCRLASSALLLAGLAVRPTAAGIDRFTPTGPLNGDLAALVIDPSTPETLLAMTTGDGIFRSADGGHTWSWSGAGLVPNDGLQGIVADPANAGSVYALTNTQVFHSADGGRHWTQVAAGQDFVTPSTPHSHAFPRLTLVPGGPGVPPTLFATGAESVQRSGDGGVTWSTVFTDFTFILVTGWGPAADPTDPERLWLDPPGGGLLVSTDAGQSWAPVPGFPAPRGTLDTLLVLPTSPVTILAADGTTIWKSADAGASWRAIPERAFPVAYETQTPSFVYALLPYPARPFPLSPTATLFVSADAGESWTPRALPPAGAPLPIPGTRALYALGQNDLSWSPDRGRHESLLTAGGLFPLSLFDDVFSTRLRFLPGDPATAYAVEGGRAFPRADGGASWASFASDREPLHSALIQDLAVDPGDPARVDLATDQGVFRSADGGASWAFAAPRFKRLEFAGRTLLGGGCGVARSADGGRTWTATLSCPAPVGGITRQIDRLVVDPTNPKVVYAAGLDVAPDATVPVPHVWQSLDRGATWRILVPDGNVVALDPTRRGRLYVARSAGLLRSDDSGRTFRRVGSFPASFGPFPGDLLVDPATPTTLYAATMGLGVWRSTDGGATWAPVNAGLSGYGLFVRQLVPHPTVPHQLYVFVANGLLTRRFTSP